VAGDCPRTLGRQTLSPILCCQSPSDFHTGRKRSKKCRNAQTDEPNEAPVSPILNRAQSEPVLSKVSLDSVCQRVTLFSRKNVRHVLHHSNIGIETSEWLTVGLTPVPEDQPLRCNRSKNHWGRLTDLGFDGCLRTFTLVAIPRIPNRIVCGSTACDCCGRDPFGPPSAARFRLEPPAWPQASNLK
jgi:hypothetical protein